LYFDYLKEKTDKKVLEMPGLGFSTYSYTELFNSDAVYIEDVYVIPKLRRTRLASTMANEIYKKAKELGCEYALGSVQVDTKDATESLKVLIAHGMKLLKCEDQLIWFYKEI